MTRARGLVACLLVVAVAAPGARAQPGAAADLAAKGARLIAAYPDHLDRLDGAWLVFKDGTRLLFDDGKRPKSFARLLADPDIKDQFAQVYPAGAPATQPPVDFDPGRIRNTAFFTKIYGDCSKHEVEPRLVRIDWLPRKKGGHLAVTAVNGVADHLRAVSVELDALPSSFDAFLVPPAGVYNCRDIAGTRQRSVHAYGAAVDIATRHSDYWRWAKRQAGSPDASTPPYRNQIPAAIIRIFERHGFIWGGRWSHFDTMHFEYRPELLPARK